MQKTIEQDLSGSETKASEIAQYTWAKDEIAYYYCYIYRDVFKVEFTGKHWLSGNKWKYNKIYQYKCIDSSGDQSRLDPSHEYNVSHDDEKFFFTERQEAIDCAKSHIKKRKDDAISEYDKDLLRLLEYQEKIKHA